MRPAAALLAPLVLASGAALAGCGATEVVDRTPDGRAILIRAPQPDAEDLTALAAAEGVRTVVNLRKPAPGEGWYEEERRAVAAIGARWVQLPTSGRSAPDAAWVAAALDLLGDPAGWPVLVHCQGGVHRTGLVVALYRLQFQGWSADAAIEDLEDHWFDWTVEDRDALKRFLRAYRRDPARTLGAAPAAPPGP